MEDNDRYIDYVQKMRKVSAFQFFGIHPQWHPGQRDIEGFCHDEVVRQGHDTRDWHDGGKRIEYMLDAWHYAQAEALRSPTLDDILKLGALVEPDYNRDGFRHQNVYIGDRMGAYPPYLHQLVELLATRAPEVQPGKVHSGKQFLGWLQIENFKDQVESITSVDEWYLAYEWIHPFRDGNGRSGKVLHNWLGGTLDDPELVPDYFGGGNP